MANKKRIATTLGAMALTAAIAIGGTLAYLSNVTETKTNTFSSAGDVHGKIEETEWDKTHKDGWTDYRPGESAAKDPKIALEEGSESAWVAMKLTFKDATDAIVPYETFKGYAAHDGINDGWKLIAKNGLGEELYFYSTEAIKGGKSTAPVFDNITVNAGVTTVGSSTTTDYYKRVVEYDADGKVISDKLEKVNSTTDTSVAYYDKDGNAVGSDSLPTFSIDTKGYAIQSSEVNADLAIAELIKLANTNVTEAKAMFYAV